jgi:mono/diheme cytochrome c family protein
MRRVWSGMIVGLAVACVLNLTAARPIGRTGQAGSGGNPEAKKLKNPVPASAESIAAGKQVYQKLCRFCHGADAKGNGPMAPEGTHPPNLVDGPWSHGSSEGEIFVVIQDGIGPKFDMKAFKGKISDQDIWNVVNYLRSLGPQPKSH